MGEKYETMAEIEGRYDGEWVLIDRPTSERGRPETVTGGYVVLHSPDRDVIYHRLRNLADGELTHFAVRLIGWKPGVEEWTVDPAAAEATR